MIDEVGWFCVENKQLFRQLGVVLRTLGNSGRWFWYGEC